MKSSSLYPLSPPTSSSSSSGVGVGGVGVGGPSAAELRLPTRVELEPDGSVDIFVDEDEEALLVTAQDGVRFVYFKNHPMVSHQRRELFENCIRYFGGENTGNPSMSSALEGVIFLKVLPLEQKFF